METAEFIEVLAVISGLGATWFFIKQRIVAWWWGIVSVLAYLWIFWQVKLFANFFVFFVFLILQGYGWWRWKQGEKENSKVVECPSHVTVLSAGLVGLFGYFALAILLQSNTGAQLVWWDSFAGTLALLAQWMLTRRYLWTWGFWFLSNIIYAGIYYHQALYLTVGLYVLYIGLSIKGYCEWRSKLRPLLVV